MNVQITKRKEVREMLARPLKAILFICISLMIVHSFIKEFQVSVEEEKISTLSYVPDSSLNHRPIIGIISQPLTRKTNYLLPGGTYISASYVKWIEASGARVAPLILGSNQNFTEIFTRINGLVIPGGISSLAAGLPLPNALRDLYDLAKESNDAGDPFPIIGMCLGFHAQVYMTEKRRPIISECDAFDMATPLLVKEGSRMFSQAPPEVRRAIDTERVAPHYHRNCLLTETFYRFEMNNTWRISSTNIDREGVEFVSSMEQTRYPFYALIFHPEKIRFEWVPKFSQIPRSRSAIRFSEYIGEFFINEAKKSKHRFTSREEEEAHLIYPHPTVYTGGIEGVDWTYQTIYTFPPNLDIHKFNKEYKEKVSSKKFHRL